MSKIFKINDIITNSLTEHDFKFSPEWTISMDDLSANWLSYCDANADILFSSLQVKTCDITPDELFVFYNILWDMMSKSANLEIFLQFYQNELVYRLSKNNKYYYKLNIDTMINKFITQQVKQRDYKIYKKFIGNKKSIDNNLIMILLITTWNDYDLALNLTESILRFKNKLVNPYHIKKIYQSI